MSLTIDLNADVGERPQALCDGSEEKILGMISSANIACGAHAGDENTMAQVVTLCKRYNVAIGAHPSYPDRANFGRVEMPMPPLELEESIFQQVRALGEIAKAQGAELQHVKPHGGLYHVAVHDCSVAEAIARGVARWSRALVLVGLAGSQMLAVWEAMGFRAVAEAFVDRAYEADGTLRARHHQDALIHSPQQAALQALRIIKEQRVFSIDNFAVPVRAETLCVHSDTPNAAAVLSTVRERFALANIAVSSLSSRKPRA